MSRLVFVALLFIGLCLGPAVALAEREMKPVDLTGTVREFRPYRTWNTYYWGRDFTFLLDDTSGKTWRIISREITPAYGWQMGPTYPQQQVDWDRAPRARVIGVEGIDRIPPTFHDLKLDEPRVSTAFVVLLETEPDTWCEFYVNSWFHSWGQLADRAIHAWYADRPGPYDVYGWVGDMVAPFDARSQAVVDRHSGGKLIYHGRIRTAAGRGFGYEVELLHLIGRDPATGGGAVLYGDEASLIKLDTRPPK